MAKHNNTDSDSNPDPQQNMLLNIILSGGVSCLVVGSVFMTYYFAASEMMKHHLDGKPPKVLAGFIYAALALALITLILTMGVDTFKETNKLLKKIQSKAENPTNSTDPMTCCGWVGVILSVVAAITYAMWVYFAVSSIFRWSYSPAHIIVSIFAIMGITACLLLFIMPKAVRALNSYSKKREQHTWNWKRIIAALLGEAFLAPVLINSARTDLQEVGCDKTSAYILAGIFVGCTIAAITLAVSKKNRADAEPKQAGKKASIRNVLLYYTIGAFLLVSTGIVGGAFATFDGISDLGFMPNNTLGTILTAIWACVPIIYYISLYKEAPQNFKDFLGWVKNIVTKEEASNNPALLVDGSGNSGNMPCY
jgi:hypothetical protein